MKTTKAAPKAPKTVKTAKATARKLHAAKPVEVISEGIATKVKATMPAAWVKANGKIKPYAAEKAPKTPTGPMTAEARTAAAKKAWIKIHANRAAAKVAAEKAASK